MDRFSVLLKYGAGAGLYLLWSFFVYIGKTDAGPLIAAIGAGISALLGFHAITNLQGVKQDVGGQLAAALQALRPDAAAPAPVAMPNMAAAPPTPPVPPLRSPQ